MKFVWITYICLSQKLFDNNNPKGNVMKKLVIVTGAIAAIATTVASAAILISYDKQTQFERAARLQNLSVVAVKNKDFNLACKAQIEVVDALAKAQVKGHDLVGTATQNKKELCGKAKQLVAAK
jgi:hypothetical protein